LPELDSKYRILLEHNLVIQDHSGILNLKNYIRFAENLYKDPLYSSNLNHLINIKNVSIKASFNDLSLYANFSKRKFKKPKHRNIAVITKTPDQVVLPTLFKMLGKSTSQTVEIFSTLKAASDWLEIDENIIKKLI